MNASKSFEHFPVSGENTSKRLGLNRFPDGVTLDQQYNTGEKPTVMLYIYIINRHAGTPDKNRTITFLVHNKIGL